MEIFKKAVKVAIIDRMMMEQNLILTQTPVLLFALMMVSFIVVVGGLATADLVRKRRD